MAKVKITARKHGGDDAYSWAVFYGDQCCFSGLHKSEVSYYKRQVREMKEGK